jgi:hypothetical protein
METPMSKIITAAMLGAFALAFVSAPVTFDPASPPVTVAKVKWTPILGPAA